MEEVVRRLIEAFVERSPENRFSGTGEPFFTTPLTGFAAASDRLFTSYKTLIGNFHLTPQELLASECGEGVRAATVICWVLPISTMTRESNSHETRFPSLEWAMTRDRGEGFNVSLRRHVVNWLLGKGYNAVAPQLTPVWRQMETPEIGIASTWSERHAAYAAGLGTFSLNDGLITERGIAHRLGSVVTDLPLAPTRHTAPDYRHNCLWYREGSCGVCIGRCPVGAITAGGHDKALCRDYVYGNVPEQVGARYGVSQTGCGLCQTRVPCEGAVP